jgi:hypothetical protein
MGKNKRVFRSAIALAVTIVHLVVVCATAAESWRANASAHVEQGGTQRHFAHNDATCPLCTAQSMHARIEPHAPPSLASRLVDGASVERVGRPVTRQALAANGSRAPPA